MLMQRFGRAEYKTAGIIARKATVPDISDSCARGQITKLETTAVGVTISSGLFKLV